MQISVNWLKEYVDIDTPIDELAHSMTMLGLEIEAVTYLGQEVQDVYVGKILSIEPHPDADKLVVCKTDVGGDAPLQIVCGATNMSVGDRVPTAVVGASLPGGFKIARRKMRGLESQGMMCSPRELGLGDDHAGLMILDGDLPLGQDVKPLLGLDDVVMEIEVIPNRGDWASMIGVARELAALHGKQFRVPEIEIRESDTPAAKLSSVTIDDADLCPRYIGRVLQNVKVGPSPQWLCKRLIAAGQRPINNIVDITNFVLLETGHPLHAFDYDKLAGHRVVVRRAKAGEKMTTLDGEDRTLSGEMLVIADAERAQAVAGVMGGADSEVGEGTTTVFLESAYFDPVSVRRTSRALGLVSEAAQHFQRGADPEMAVQAINRCAALIQDLAGGHVAQGLIDEYPTPLAEQQVRLRYARTGLLLGTEIAPEFQRNALEKLGFELLDSNAEGFTVRVPTWRHDVSGEADLIEEIARLHGYDKLPATLPRVRQSEAAVFAPHDRPIRALRRHLAGLGLTELYSWTFSSAAEVRRAGLPERYLNMVALENPLSENHAAMRTSLLPGLLAVAAHNIHRGTADIQAFEIGPIFTPKTDQELPVQSCNVCILLTGSRSSRHWSTSPEQHDFYDAVGYAEEILGHFGQEARFAPGSLKTFQEGQAAAVLLDGAEIGHLGKVDKNVLRSHDIEGEVFLLELGIDSLLDQVPAPAQFREIPSFPPSLRDLAVVVDESVEAGALADCARNFGGNFLKSVEIFDVYRGEQLPEGKKSVALSLRFQSAEKTLTDKNTQKAINKICKRLTNDYGAELR